jgi:peptide/nickel transport system substrate-binding protein
MTARRLRYRLAAGLAALGLLGAAAGIAGAPSATAASDKTLTIGIFEGVRQFNPFTSILDPELFALAVTYPTLAWPDAHGTATHYLADSWTTSPDKLTWTFKLHGGLKWSDGKPITADDVAWTLNLVRTNKAAATANGQLVSNVTSVTAPNETTVVVKTKSPQANMLYTVAAVPIVPRHVWQSKVANITDQGTTFPFVGYGPFIFQNYKTDQYVTLKTNKDFFLGAPKYDTVILQLFKNADAAVAALKSGQVDQVDKLTATEYRALGKDSSLLTYQQVGYRWTAVEVNPGARTKSGKKMGTGNPILADATVRKAIAYGVDRPTLVKKVMDGLAQVGSGYLPPAFPQFHWQPSASQAVTYDPAKANQLLDAAGYKKGADGIRTDPKTGKPLSFRLGIHSEDVNDAQIANYLVGWMKAIGIKLTIQSMSNAALNNNLSKGDWDLLMDGWGTPPDPTYLLGIQTCGVLPDDNGTGGNTDAFYCDPAYDRLYDAQQAEFDPAKRAQDIKQMQAMLYAANDDIIFYYQNQLAALRKDASNGFIAGSKNAQGFYPYQNPWWAWINAAPSKSSSSSSGSSNTGVIVGVVVAVVVVVLVAGGVFLRRRSSAADRE